MRIKRDNLGNVEIMGDSQSSCSPEEAALAGEEMGWRPHMPSMKAIAKGLTKSVAVAAMPLAAASDVIFYPLQKGKKWQGVRGLKRIINR